MYFSFSCPVPVNDLSAKIGDIAIVELVVSLGFPGPLLWAWMERRVVVWLLRWWETVPYLLRSLEGIHTDRPNLCDLACQLGCQERQIGRNLAIICQPHQVSVDKNCEIVTSGVGFASMTYED